MWRIAPLGLRDRFILSSTALITLLMSVVIFFVEMERPAALKKRAEDHASAIAQMFVLDNGELWVLSSRGIYDRPEGTAVVFDVFDSEGDLIRQTALVGDLDPEQDSMYLIGNRLYVVSDALGATLSALSAEGDEAEDPGEVEPSNIVCFEMVAVE